MNGGNGASTSSSFRSGLERKEVEPMKNQQARFKK